MSTYGREIHTIGLHSGQPIDQLVDAILDSATREGEIVYDIIGKTVLEGQEGMRDFYLFNDRSHDMKVVQELQDRGYAVNTHEDFDKNTITFYDIRPIKGHVTIPLADASTEKLTIEKISEQIINSSNQGTRDVKLSMMGYDSLEDPTTYETLIDQIGEQLETRGYIGIIGMDDDDKSNVEIVLNKKQDT
jgi:hypothetical protein